MDYAKTKLAVAIAVLACAVATAVPAVAQQQVVLPPPILVTTPIVTINHSPGDQIDAHVSKDLAAYTDNIAGQIRYYRFSTGVDAAIPTDPTFVDILSDVSGDLVAFSRITPDRNAIMVFDTLTSSLTEIDPHLGTNRLGVAIGGNTVAFIDLSIVLQAVGVTQTSDNSPVAFDDTGNANPDFDFRYDATFDGYIFNLSTKGYRTGMYSLSFAAGADPTVHTASFAVK